MLHDLQKLPPGLAADILGMGTWRLKGAIDGVINFITGRIENSFRELMQNGGARALLGLGCQSPWGLLPPAGQGGSPALCCAALQSRPTPAARSALIAELTLYPPSKWKDKGWDFIDSLDPQREWDGW